MSRTNTTKEKDAHIDIDDRNVLQGDSVNGLEVKVKILKVSAEAAKDADPFKLTRRQRQSSSVTCMRPRRLI